jgi:hypothetical protein
LLQVHAQRAKGKNAQLDETPTLVTLTNFGGTNNTGIVHEVADTTGGYACTVTT